MLAAPPTSFAAAVSCRLVFPTSQSVAGIPEKLPARDVGMNRHRSLEQILEEQMRRFELRHPVDP